MNDERNFDLIESIYLMYIRIAREVKEEI